MEIIDSEESIVTSERVQEGFEPSPLPPPAPDGGPMLEPAPFASLADVTPMCDRGPCRHRHLFQIATEHADALDGSPVERPKLGPDGEPIVKYQEPPVLAWDGTQRPGRIIYETEPYVPRTVTRVCYPCAGGGVKIELSEDEPILECDRWDPEDPDDPEIKARESRRARFLEREAAADAATDHDTSSGGGPVRRGKR